MAVIGNEVLTLVDYTKRLAPDGAVERDIAELLSQQNEILTDMLWMQGNLETGHRVTMRTGLPAGTWRKLNQGIANTKSTTAQVDETCGMYFQRGQIDKDLANLNGNSAAFRLSENVAHLEAMGQELAETLFYGDTDTNPERFLGLAPRYSSLSAGNAQNILDAGGNDSDLASIWLVCYGPKGAYGIFPKGSTSGIKHMAITDNSGDGCTEARDDNGRSFRAFVDEYNFKAGFCLKDWRYVVRIANIDISALAALSGAQATTAATFILKLMARAIDRVPSMQGVKPVFYMNRTIHSLLRIAAMEKTSNVLAIEPGLNQFKTTFEGIPLRKNDALLNSETRVV